MLAKLLFSSELNETYKDIANIYHKYWSETDNVKRIFRTPITTCSVCSTYNSNAVSVLGLYFDAMPYHSVTVLDAAVLTIMTILHKDQLLSDNEAAMHIISTLDPDTIKNHYFINVCGQRERVTNDLDVVEFLKKILFGIKTKTTNIRDYANLTKLLKKECIGDCNTFFYIKHHFRIAIKVSYILSCSYTGLVEFLYKNYSDTIKRDNIRYSSSQCKLDDNLSGYCGYNRQRKELNSEYHKCAIDFTENIWYKVYGFCEFSCPLECSTNLYDYKMGFLNFPSDETNFERLNSSAVNYSDGFEKLKQNVLRLELLFEKITYTLIEQKPKMMLVDLIATIGGTLGRFRG